MSRVLVPIDLPDDSKIEYVVSLRTGRDGHPIREQLLPIGPAVRSLEEAVRPALTVDRKSSLEERVTRLERQIAALEPTGVE